MTARQWCAASVVASIVALAAAAGARTAAAADALAAFVTGLPKAELHVHLEGTLEPELYVALARRNGIATPYADAEAVRRRLTDAQDLPSFIAIYEELVGALRTEADFHDLAYAYFVKARSQGVVHAEVYVDPQLHVERGVPLAALYGGLAAARREARERLGLEAAYILSFLRDRSAAAALDVLEASLPWRDELVGVGLDNPEVPGFPAKFAVVFERAAQLGLHRTTHCDVDQPDSVAHHRAALDVLHVERIDHGLNVLDDPALVADVRARGIGLLAAPTLFHRDIPGRMARRAGAIRRMLDAGLEVSVHSDDPGMKRGLYVADLMHLVALETGMGRDDLAELARNSFRSAWIDGATRRRHLALVDAWLRQDAERPLTDAAGSTRR